MANELEKQILQILNQARDEIRVNMQNKRINASGRTSASIHVEVFDGGFRLVGGSNGTHRVTDYPEWRGTADASDTAPIPTLEFGRGASKHQPPAPRAFYYIIRQWSHEKGISFSSESERSTFAYFLSKKIIREGTARSRANMDVYSTPVNNAKERLQQLFQSSLQNTLRAALGGVKTTNLRGAFMT